MPTFIQLVRRRQRLWAHCSMTLKPKLLTNLPIIKIDSHKLGVFFYFKKKRECFSNVNTVTWINRGSWDRTWILWIVWDILDSLPICLNLSPLLLLYRSVLFALFSELFTWCLYEIGFRYLTHHSPVCLEFP